MERTDTPEGRRRLVLPSRVDRAYASFSWAAFVTCGVSILDTLVQRRVDFATHQVIGMLVVLPLAMSALGAAGLGMILAVVCWREWPLLVNSASVVSLLFFFLQEESHVMGEGMALAGEVLSLAVLVVVCVRWFVFVRPRAAARGGQPLSLPR